MKRRIYMALAGVAISAAALVPAAPALAAPAAPAPATATATSAASPLLGLCLTVHLLNLNQCIVL